MTATAATSERTLRGALLRPVPRSLSRGGQVAVVLGLAVGAAMVAASSVIHLHLWAAGYKHIHLIGPAFLLQFASGAALALVLLSWHRLLVVVAGVLWCAGSATALLLSATVGFLGLHDGLGVPWAGWSLATELIGLVVLLACGAVMLRRA